MQPLAFVSHDHKQCRHSVLDSVEKACTARGLRLTPVRRRVLEILLEGHRAVGAYEVLRRLTEDGSMPKPPTAYRALDFLVANGFAHRIERLNAFVACCDPKAVHRSAFLICHACHAVAEVDASMAARSLGTSARSIGFEIDTAVIEVEGLCARCSETPEAVR